MRLPSPVHSATSATPVKLSSPLQLSHHHRYHLAPSSHDPAFITIAHESIRQPPPSTLGIHHWFRHHRTSQPSPSPFTTFIEAPAHPTPTPSTPTGPSLHRQLCKFRTCLCSFLVQSRPLILVLVVLSNLV
jgi:hypothetical protein